LRKSQAAKMHRCYGFATAINHRLKPHLVRRTFDSCRVDAIDSSQRLIVMAKTRRRHDPTRLRRVNASHRAKSVGSADKVRKRAHELFCLDWFVQTRCPLQSRTIKLTFTVAGNNYKRYLSRDQSIDEISR
jgi:hypothetical protein